MTLSRIAGLAVLSILLSAQAQTPVPPPPPAAGPTMEQTLAFINDAFNKSGKISNSMILDGGRIIPWIEVQSQTVSLQGSCILRYHTLYNVSHTDPDDVVQDLRLDVADPRTISVTEDGPKFSRKLSEVTLKADSRQPVYTDNGVREEGTHEILIGRLENHDLALRVAKAYIHAISLCHKPEASSLF